MASALSGNLRANDRLVCAVWLNQPANSFGVEKNFTNPFDISPDDDNSVVAGEDGLSDLNMESFIQDCQLF